MRIVSIEGVYSRGSDTDPFVVKPTWSTYGRAATARAYLKAHFGPIEIKRVEGGYALYTRCNRTKAHIGRRH
jgi:hypothetical protein